MEDYWTELPDPTTQVIFVEDPEGTRVFVDAAAFIEHARQYVNENENPNDPIHAMSASAMRVLLDIMDSQVLELALTADFDRSPE